MKKQESTISTVLLQGTIASLERSRRCRDFVLTQVQHQQIGATAIAASAMGMGAAGIGLIGMASNSDEEADWVQFELSGKQVQGWLWMLPMHNGDKVEVAAEKIGENRYIAYAVKRESDDLLAIYPHATAGRGAHFRKSLKIWFWCSLILYLITSLFMLGGDVWRLTITEGMKIALILAFPFWMIFSGIVAFRVSRKLNGFARMAEIIFRTFGWSDVKNIDLRKTSRKDRCGDTSINFGKFYFRFKG